VTSDVIWVIGRGGLLGRNVEPSLALAFPGAELWRIERPIRWQNSEEAAAMLEHESRNFFGRAARAESWRLLWCAGTGVVATDPDALSQETTLLAHVLGAVAGALEQQPRLSRHGTVFLASSAGGVYAGGTPPFDESSPPAPMSAYGREKLLQEELAANVAARHGLDLLIGRFSNLYGPGQNLAKPHGLVAHVGLAALRREPVLIYVPLDTIRDYLFAADAGRMVAEALRRRDEARGQGDPPATTVKIFASETETTVASVLAAWRLALRRPLRFALGSSPTSHLQPRVLSFRSCVWPEVRGLPTLLPVGVDAVRRDQLARLLRPAA
jgi:UDP-glucose 4-epimerase